MRIFKARMERRELDRNPRRLAESALSFFRNAVERTTIGFGIAFSVAEGLRRLAQHVEAVAEALALLRLGALQRLIDGPAEHEVAAKDLHRFANCGTHYRLAQAA